MIATKSSGVMGLARCVRSTTAIFNVCMCAVGVSE